MITPDDITKRTKAWLDSFHPKTTPDLPEEKQKFIRKTLGYAGRMLSGSKRAVKNKDGREHFAVWNANLIIEGYGKVWYGDIDITNEEDELKAIAKEVKAKVYVLREHDARFSNENAPKIENAVYTTDGVTGSVGDTVAAYYERDAKSGDYLTKGKSNE